jgi:hypothetical protein
MAGAGILISVTAASASTTAPYVRDGDRGYAVWCVQYALNNVYPRLHLDEDSKFGPATLAGVKQLSSIGHISYRLAALASRSGPAANLRVRRASEEPAHGIDLLVRHWDFRVGEPAQSSQHVEEDTEVKTGRSQPHAPAELP